MAAQPGLDQPALGVVAGQLEGAPVGDVGVLVTSCAAQQLGQGRVPQVVAGELAFERLQLEQRTLGLARAELGEGDRAVEADDG